MPTDEIVDNSTELAFDDPKMVEFLATVNSGMPAPLPATQPDVKKDAASSAASTGGVKSTSDEDIDEDLDASPENLKAQVKGLQAELTRRRGNSDRVDELQTELQALKTKLETPASTKLAWMQKLDDDDLASKQTDWDDELADARARYARAEDAGDDRNLEKHGQRILTAKEVLSAFRKETRERTNQVLTNQKNQDTLVNSISAELTDMQTTVDELMPELRVRDSAAWTAGKEEYDAHPTLMTQLGPFGEVVACALAIIKNPELATKKSASSARKDVVNSLERSVKRSLTTGVSAATTPRNVDYAAALGSGDDLAKFNAMIDKIKGG